MLASQPARGTRLNFALELPARKTALGARAALAQGQNRREGWLITRAAERSLCAAACRCTPRASANLQLLGQRVSVPLLPDILWMTRVYKDKMVLVY